MSAPKPSGESASWETSLSPRNGVLLPAGEKTVWKKFLTAACAILLPAAILTLLRVWGLHGTGGENSLDAYYHVRMAELGPDVYLSREFPALQLSIWRYAFADKELLFHFLLRCFFMLGNLFGISAAPPFHFASALFFLLLAGSFVFTAFRMKLRPLLILAGSILFCLLSSAGTVRLTMLRPHLLSVAFLTLAFGIQTNGNSRFRTLAALALSFVYAWTYSNPHFLVLPFLFVALFEFRKESWCAFLPALAALSGVMLGLLIHPQFPNSFIIWKVQSFNALVSPLNVYADVNLIPGEMKSPVFFWQLTALPVCLLGFLNIRLLIRLWEFRGFDHVPSVLPAVTCFSLLFTFAMFFSLRSVEYAMPFAVIAQLGLFECALREKIPFFLFRNPRRACAFFAAAAFICAAATVCLYPRHLKRQIFTPKPLLGRYLAEHFHAGQALLNADWSDFPQLFHAAPKIHWQWGLDPAFSLACDKRKTALLTATIPAAQFYAETGLEYAVLLHPRFSRANHMLSCGWRIVKEIPGEGWVFAATPAVSPASPPGSCRETEFPPAQERP